MNPPSGVERKTSAEQELSGRLDDAVATPAAQSLGQPAAPSEEISHCYAGTLDLALGSIQDPFRGNLPQREEWVEIWAESISAISFRKQEAVREMRGVSQICRRRKRHMVAVAAEVARESCRKRLREASSVSVAFSECDTRKIIRARRDTPEPPHQWDGVLGIVRKQYGVHGDVSAELKDDHAVQNLRLLE